MNIDEAVARACKEPTLLDALSWICVWESERTVKQALKSLEIGVKSGSNGAGWDTCFRHCLQRVMESYIDVQEKVIKCTECPNIGFSRHIDAYYCREADFDSIRIYKENKDGITPSCPMYAQSMEVEG